MEKTLAFNNEDINNAMTIKLSDIPKDIPPFVKNIKKSSKKGSKIKQLRHKISPKKCTKIHT